MNGAAKCVVLIAACVVCLCSCARQARDDFEWAGALIPVQPTSAKAMLSTYACLDAYEQAIGQGLAGDGRVPLVNRDMLDKVLRERYLAILGMEAPPAPILSAEMFVFPQLVLQDERQTVLRIVAFDSPTASLLGELTVPIDAADPSRFDVPLAEQVRAWRAGVLDRLEAARTRPVWSLLDVRSDTARGHERAERLCGELEEALTASKDVFYAQYEAASSLMQEVLMSMMGLSAAAAGRFTPAADYLVDVRWDPRGRIELHLLNGRELTVAAQTVVEAGADAGWASAAEAWLAQQAAQRRDERPVTVLEHEVQIECAARQGALAMERQRELAAQIKAFDKEAGLRAWRDRGGKKSPEDEQTLSCMARRKKRLILRSAQLNPADEEAAFSRAYVTVWVRRYDELDSHLESAACLAQFVQNFPRSKRYADIMLHAIGANHILYNYMKQAARDNRYPRLPEGLDFQTMATGYLKKTVEYFDLYTARYRSAYHRSNREGSWWSYHSVVNHYMYNLALYLYRSGAGDGQVEEAVDHWKSRFGEASKVAPHSDFLRLKVACFQGDKGRYLKLLSRMQQEHPDPKSEFWVRGDTTEVSVKGDLNRLFRHNGQPCSYTLWREGKRGPGDLPYVGYDPQKDTFKPLPPE